MQIILQLTILVFTYGFSLWAVAENNSYITLESITDNANGKSYYIGTGIDFIGASQLTLSYGESDSNAITISDYAIGVMSDPSANFSSGFSYLYWEQDNAMQIDTYQLTFNRNTDDWFFSLSPEFRVVTIYPLTEPTVDINSTGLGVSADYYGSFPWYVSAGVKFYVYDRNISAFNTNQYPMFSMRSFSSATPDQASGLEDNRVTFDLAYNFSKFIIGYYYERSLSAVDDSAYTSHSIYGRLNISDNWQLGVEIGQSETSLNVAQTVTFNSASVTYNW